MENKIECPRCGVAHKKIGGSGRHYGWGRHICRDCRDVLKLDIAGRREANPLKHV